MQKKHVTERPIKVHLTERQYEIEEAFDSFFCFYAVPSKPSVTTAYRQAQTHTYQIETEYLLDHCRWPAISTMRRMLRGFKDIADFYRTPHTKEELRAYERQWREGKGEIATGGETPRRQLRNDERAEG